MGGVNHTLQWKKGQIGQNFEEDYCLTSSIFISAKASSTSEAENLTPKVMRECLKHVENDENGYGDGVHYL